MPIDSSDERFLNRAIEATIRIALVAALVVWCFTIVRPFVGPVHRIDRDTSGALAFALTPAARRTLRSLFRSHSIERRYGRHSPN